MRVVIADDQTLVRDGLVTICGRLPDVEVVATAADGAQAVRAVAEHAPDVILMDLRMPHMDGIEATRQIRDYHPATQIIVLTTFSDEESIDSALVAGALGYLTKDAGREDIANALRAAAKGQSLLSPEAHARVLVKLRQSVSQTTSPPDGLTPREVDILRLIAAGRSNREIVRELCIGESTVKTHINRIFAKTGSRDRAQAVVYAHQHGIT
ncbi:response regulator transcription factor [Rhodococcus sp. BH2-1]|nr:response regulator transcription factor [Rhodococcus sp. BH2-1]